MTSLTELLPALHDLKRADKLRAMQFLISELAKEEELLEAGKDYPVWSPYESFDAADALLNALKSDRETRHA